MLEYHLEKLRHFGGSVRSGSIRGYAVAQNLSQPSVSKSIQLLEESLETALLVRSRDGIELTATGRLLFDFSEMMLARTAEVENLIRAAGQLKLDGELTMGTYQSIGVYFVPKFFKFIRKTQRGVKLNLFTSTSAELVKAVRNGEVDFIVSIDPPQSAELFHTEIFEDTYSVYKKIDYDFNPKDYALFTVHSARDKKGKTLKSYLQNHNLDKFISTCGDFESVKAMVEEGVGLGFMPDRVANPLLMKGVIERVTEFSKLNQVGPHSIVFSCRKHRRSDHSLKWVSDQLIIMMRAKS